jgi:Tol biopolymer transport system component
MTSVDGLFSLLTGRYEFVRELGRGGMATVYLARDVRHERNVALKVLDPELGAVLGSERFLSEIRVTANLQHPNLLPLFDSGEANGLLYYVMPYVEGETLRARLMRERQLPVDFAVRLARTIAEALGYAHRHGVIHRDLKPENILLHEDKPLIADFGIALAVSNAGGERITQTGLSLGTPQYMSPEQATGDGAVDGRTDIYSLGAVLYEMLTGSPPHTGPTAQAIIARVLVEKPRPIRAERPAVPEYVELAVNRALETIPADRWSTAQEFSDALSGAQWWTGAHAIPLPGRYGRRTVAIVAVAAIALGGLGTAILTGRRASTVAGPGPVRFGLTFSPITIMASITALSSLAISPDGHLIAAIGETPGGPPQLYLRTINDPHPRAIEGTRGAQQPVFSPDGKSLAFIVGHKLMKLAVDGGAAIMLGNVTNGSSVAWVTNDSLVYETTSRLAIVSATGGPARTFTQLDAAHGEIEQRWPLGLPDGRAVMYSSSTGSMPGSRLGVATLADGRSEALNLPGTSPLGFIEGHLVYVGLTGNLMAVPFDLRTRRVTGTPLTLSDRLALGPRGSASASLSSNGTLLYQEGSAIQRAIVIDLDGHQHPFMEATGAYAYPRLSPDGKLLALTISGEGRNDVWIYTIADGTLTRLTTEGTTNERPEWTPDGSAVIYRSDASGLTALWKRAADGSGVAAPFFTPRGVQVWEGVLTPDGQTLVYRTGQIGTGDVLYRKLSGDTTPHPVAATQFSEWQPRVSPNGHWVAYASDESGAYEVYVRPFPGPGSRVQISQNGGEMPVWSRDGKRLFFASDQNMMIADLAFSPGPNVTHRSSIFVGDVFEAGSRGHAAFDVMPDGKGVLCIKPLGDTQVIVVLNWIDELRAAIKRNEGR